MKIRSELQKRADRADQSVLFFLAGANFLGKAREKLLIFGANFVWGKNWSVLIFTPFATMPHQLDSRLGSPVDVLVLCHLS